MRKKSRVLLLVIFLLLSSTSFGLLFVSVAGKPTLDLPEYVPIDIGPKIREEKLSISPKQISDYKGESVNLESAEIAFDGEYWEPGDVLTWLSYDIFAGGWYTYVPTEFKLVGISEHAEIWVQVDPNFPAGDPRNPIVCSDEDALYLLNEFENNINPKCIEYFGEYDFYDGSNNLMDILDLIFYNGELGLNYEDYIDDSGRTVILVSNFIDDQYVDPTYPYFIIGFYSPNLEYAIDRNIISIDTWDWDNKLRDPQYAYEATLAHELQHLIHDDYQLDPTSFMNEGCSMFAELLCGYPTDWSSINSFLATPDNSLTEWGDQGGINILADYGQGLLWATYLVDNYGSDILKNYVQSGITGIPGIEAQLPPGVFFDDVFHDWTMANFMRTGYTSINFNDKPAGEVRVYEVKDKWITDFYGTDFGNTITVLGYDTGVNRVGSYGTDYVLLSKLKWQYSSSLYFYGDEFAWTPHWYNDGTAWYSTSSGPLEELNLFFDVDLTGVSTLSFDTMYIIEPGWDFGFVQVSTDDGATWTSLTNEYTTDQHAGTHPDIVANLPGLTGISDGWMTMSFDVSAYSGPATICFRYMTDWGTEWDGWWINNVFVDDSLVSDDAFYTDYDPPATTFMVTVLRQDFWEGDYHYNLIVQLELDANNDGFIDLAPFLSSPGYKLRYPDVVLAISPRVGVTDYSFSVVRT